MRRTLFKHHIFQDLPVLLEGILHSLKKANNGFTSRTSYATPARQKLPLTAESVTGKTVWLTSMRLGTSLPIPSMVWGLLRGA